MATTSELSAMHTLQTKILTRLLQKGVTAMDSIETCEDTEELKVLLHTLSVCASPAILTATNQFLKNNNVTAQNDAVMELSETDKLLAQKRRKRWEDITIDTSDAGAN